jgi:diguanylate cyclase (GGDEF)-like protein/PAS domain S-box-containing protein
MPGRKTGVASMGDRPLYEELEEKIEALQKDVLRCGRALAAYRSVVESTGDSIYLVDKHGRYLLINEIHCSRIGLPRDQIIGRNYSEFHSPADNDVFMKKIEEIYARKQSLQYEYSGREEGRYFLRTLSPVRSLDADREITSVSIVSIEITERKLMEESLRKGEERYRGIIENIEDGYYEVNLRGDAFFCNDAYLKILGYSREEWLSMNYREYSNKENAQRLFEIFNGIYRTGIPVNGIEWEFRRRDGSVINIEETVSLMRDAQGEPFGFRGVIRDITERKKAEETVRQLAYHDFLTGLPNRMLFYDRFNVALEHVKRNRQKLAIMELDLDNFKNINDSFGHQAGDLLLREVGVRLKQLIRSSDTAARVGGDEFTLLLPEIKEIKDVKGIARKVLKNFKKSFICGEHTFNVSASIGMAVFPDHGDDVDKLMMHADAAMYRVKEAGKNNYQI